MTRNALIAFLATYSPGFNAADADARSMADLRAMFVRTKALRLKRLNDRARVALYELALT